MTESTIARIRAAVQHGTLVHCRQEQAIGGGVRAITDVVGERHPDGHLMWSARVSLLPGGVRREIAEAGVY